jgi:ureidoglycolate lyase
MKLLRYGPAGREKPGLLGPEGEIRDLSKVVPDLTGENLTDGVLRKIRKLDIKKLPRVKGRPRLGCPVAHPGKFLCIGLNYSDHAAETGAAIPKEPILFQKTLSSICGPNDNVILPKDSKKLDWEVELGFVIGRRGKYIPEDKALDYVAGYCVINDVSERAWQIERGGQWTKGKSGDTFGPVGPWLVTRDEVKDPQNLSMFLEVDGHRYQNGSTATMIFGVKHLVHYLSQFFTLEPGDIVSTGTPPGVGLGIKPQPVFLKAGQTMRLGVAGLGEQRQKVVAEKVR